MLINVGNTACSDWGIITTVMKKWMFSLVVYGHHACQSSHPRASVNGGLVSPPFLGHLQGYIVS